MARFNYKAIASTGETLEGEMEAKSQAAVIERLQAAGYLPIKADEVGESGGTGERFWEIPWFRANRVSQEQVAVFTQELAVLLRARLPLDRAMEILIELSETPQIKRLLTQIREQVHDGATLSAAMEAQRGVFSRLYLNMLRAGEAGGALEVVLTRLSEYLEKARELRETVTSALIYPAVLFAVAGLSVTVLLIFVVPQFQQMFEDSGKALPFATQVVIAVGEFVRGYGWTLILLAIAVVMFMRKQLANPSSRYRWDQWFLTLPLVSDLIKKLEVARFSRTLSTLLHNGVPLLTALSIVKETLNNRVLAESMGGVAESLKQGHGLAQPLSEVTHFPPLAAHMIKVGEETGNLEEMLEQVAEVYDREVRSAIKKFLALLEPALILGLGVIIAGIIMSILVAILSVNELAF